MAAPTERHHYIGPETLRDKYAGHFDRIKSLTKAIEAGSRAKITVELKKNHTIQFIVTGGKKSVDKALRDVKYEFEKDAAKPSRAERAFLDEKVQKTLQETASRTLQREAPSCLLTEAALRRHDILTGATELRQFACRNCNRPWWTHVPRTKPVSTCYSCHVRYDALDRSKEFGIGRYICLPCDNTFYARCEATEKHECFRCGKLTGPPFISPRFKPIYKTRMTSDASRPRIHKIINASTPHESTGSTIASSFITVDLGQDIYVEVEPKHAMAAKDYSKPFKDEPVSPAVNIPFKEGDEDSVIGEAGDLESVIEIESEGEHFDEEPEHFESQHEECASEFEGFESESEGAGVVTSRKRTTASDSSDSDSDEMSGEDKMSTHSSEPDSGIGTGSNVCSASVGSVSSSAKPSVSTSTCEFKPAGFSGIVFSKRKEEVKVTSDGGKITGEGIRLTVPPGAVRDGDEANVLLQACLGGPFRLPDGLIFASPVYLIEPPFAFHKNVTLSINLFVKMETHIANCEEIVFVTSPIKSVFDQSDTAQWKFREFGSPRFNEESNTGEIDLNHFCFSAFATKLGHPKQYCVHLLKPKRYHAPISHVVFSVTLHHAVYRENLQRYFNVNYGHDSTAVTKLIHFSEEAVYFNLPEQLAKTQEYILSSDISPCQILKEEVDYPVRHKKKALKDIALYPPRVVLEIRQKKSTTPDLQFDLKVEGIQEDITLNVFIPAAEPYSVPSSDSGSTSSSDTSSHRSSTSSENAAGSDESSVNISPQASSGYFSQDSEEGSWLDKKPSSFKDLLTELNPLADRWKVLAVCLGLEGAISHIEADGKKVADKLQTLLLKWRASPPKEEPYSWRTIIKALEEPLLSEHDRANQIREKFS